MFGVALCVMYGFVGRVGVLRFDTCCVPPRNDSGGSDACESAPLAQCTVVDDALRAFTRWDSAQFLSIADKMWGASDAGGGDRGEYVESGTGANAWDGYTTEASHAFMPLFPLCIRTCVSFGRVA